MTRRVILSAASAGVLLLAIGLAVGSSGEGFLFWGMREPIFIFGDSGFTYQNGVIAGSGTAEDPYLIEGWRIAAERGDYGIRIDHTTRPFLIRNCVVEQAGDAAIELNSVSNGTIEGCFLLRSETGVLLINSRAITVCANVIAENRYGVVMAANSRDNGVTGNSFLSNGLAGLDSERRNAWYRGTIGNYWSDYAGKDADGDGIGDRPYAPLDDPYPLIAPPIEWVDFPPFFPGGAVAPQVVGGMVLVTSRTPIELSAIDPGSGLAAIYFSIDGGEWKTYFAPFTLTGPDGVRRVSYYAVDRLGNAEPIRTLSFLLDNAPPKTTIEVGNPTYKDAAGQWVTSKSPIALSAEAGTEPTGITTYFRIDGGEWVPYTRPFALAVADGPHSVSYYSRDGLGNAEPVRTVTLLKDDTPPTTRGTSGGLPAAPAAGTGDTKPATETPAVQTPPLPPQGPATEVQTPSQMTY